MNTTDNNINPKSGLRQAIDIAWKIFLPIAIGLAVAMWLFHREFSHEVWQSIQFDTHVTGCIFLAWLFMAGRDFGLTWRFRTLTDKHLTWKQALKVDLLCEFTSCVTPSAVGGSAFGMIYLNREGIELGRSTTLMMTTLFLDELFLVVSIPLIMMTVPYSNLFDFEHNGFTTGLQTVFWGIYSVFVIWTAVLFLGIIVKPYVIHKFLKWAFHFRLLRKWSSRADQLGQNMETAGRDLRKRPPRWWIETFGATALSWTSRYLVVNALFLGFAPHADQAVVFARQFVVWACLMISPTPGSAGISEWLFTTYYGDMLHNAGIALIIALFWRMISYYIYLIAGSCIIPTWIRGFSHAKKSAESSPSSKLWKRH